MPKPALPAFVARVRRDDPDRFFAALLAPAALREDLLLIAAFDLETAAAARRRTELAGAFPALVRLQWWRDLVEGRTGDPAHEIAGPLQEAIGQGRLERADLLRMLDGREAEAEGVPDWPAWRDCMLAGAGGAAVSAARLLGVADPERIAPVGAAREIWSMRAGTAFLPDGEPFDALDTEAGPVLRAAESLRLERRQRAVLLPARAARERRRRTAIAVQWSMLLLWLRGGRV